MTVKPTKKVQAYPGFVFINETNGDIKNLVFSTQEELDAEWTAILDWYGCKSTTRHYRPIAILPRLIPSHNRSRRMRDAGASYGHFKMYQMQVHLGDKTEYRICFGHMADPPKVIMTLKEECWGGNWPQ